jgi:hypothetical protein
MRLLRPLRPELIALLSALLLAAPVAHAADPPAAASAAATPGARTADLSFSIDGGSIVIKDAAAGSSYRLHPVAAAVFVLSDGKTTIADIRKGAANLTGYDVDETTAFAALDALADARLLLARVTPPGGSDLDLVVLTDGALGTELVASPAPKEGTKVDTAKLKERENQAKQANAKPRAMENEVKVKDHDVQSAVKAKTAAITDLVSARQRLKEAEAKKDNGAREKAASEVAATTTTARAAATTEGRTRRTEQKTKQQQQ